MVGSLAQVAVPLAASAAGSALAPGVGTALGSSLGTSVPAWLSSGLTGAAMGGIGSALLGQNPLQGALLGGIGGGIASQMGIGDSLGSLFDSGVNPSTAATDAALAQGSSPFQLSSSFDNVSPVSANKLDAVYDLTQAPMVSTPSASSQINDAIASAPTNGFWDSKLGKFVPYAGIGAAALLADRMMAPEQVGPPMREERKSRPVAPMDRDTQAVDPLTYLTSGGNRLYFKNVNPGVRYLAEGGSAREMDREESNLILSKMATRLGEDHPMIEAAGHIVNRYNKDRNNGYPGSVMSYVRDEYGDVPVTREMRKAYQSFRPGRDHGFSHGGKIKKYSNGGSSQASSMNIPEFGIGRRIKGRGDGMDDKIPAMLSDGEFVISAPVVSALGNGSNDAGARKLDKLQKKVLKKHYKGGKVVKSYGLGAYVH